MSKKGFDLAALAREAMGEAAAVSEVDTVERIAADLIEANDANFYEMSDLEELASSIELVGLLHPVIVKQNNLRTKPYILIDGERRYRAMTEVLGWTAVPCLVRRPMNDVVEELMLIEANRTQRKMSAADLSKQAERYTELLAKLKESGVAIPGRLRDRVAEALQVSASKLARLHAIRENLEPGLLSLFDDGDLNESTAYELSKFDHMKQARIWDALADANLGFSVEHVQRAAERDDLAMLPNPPKKLPSWSAPAASYDAEEYLRQRQDEDDDFFMLLSESAPRFLSTLSVVMTRREGIEALKNKYKYSGSGSSFRDWQGSPKGLTMESMDRKIKTIFRTWTEVYDMLCAIALNRLAMAERRSNSDTPPAGIEWHKVTDDDLPPDDGEVIFWGVKGLRTAVSGSRVSYCQMWPDEYRWWAAVDGPEEGE